MKLFPTLTLVAAVTGLLILPVSAKDHDKNKDKDKDKKHKKHSEEYYRDHLDHRGSYYSRPSSTIIVQRERQSYEARPSYSGRSSYSGGSIEIDVQRGLARRGYYHGPIDGDIGPGSRSSIRAFQSHNGFAPTGRIDRGLLEALR